MMLFFALLLLALCATPVNAQISEEQRHISLNRCDVHIKQALMRGAPAGDARTALEDDGGIVVLIRGDVARLPELIRINGGRVRGRHTSVVTARLPLAAVLSVASDPAVEKISLAMPISLDIDSVRQSIGADAVHAGTPPQTQSRTGRGVVLGFIDTGIDILHPEFRDNNNPARTRIISIWSQRDTSGPSPLNFGYGHEWNAEQIAYVLEDTVHREISHKDSYGHGTHVAGIAAGVSGVAPDADIVMVQIHGSFAALTSDAVDATAYIFDLAERLGRPCVINASISTYRTFLDGSDEMTRSIDEMVAEAPGRLFVASAGNRGEIEGHWGGFSAEKDSIWTYVYSGDTYLRVADSLADGLEYSLMAYSVNDELAPQEYLGRTPWRSVADVLAAQPGTLDSIMFSPVAWAVIASTASELGNGHVGLFVTRGEWSSGCIFRLMVRGKGIFHCWDNRIAVRSKPELFPIDTRYRASDNASMTGAPALGRNVISVASSVNRDGYQTADSFYIPRPPVTLHALSDFSSRGPSVDGRVKPDICAPGENVISARSRHSVLSPIEPNLPDSHYIVMSGTSMSAPAVSGAVALLLERDPTSSAATIRETLITTARHDSITEARSPTPNAGWGYGRLDIAAAMLYRNSDVPTAKRSRSTVVPNPAHNRAMVHIQATGPVKITVVDITGRTVISQRFDYAPRELPMDVSHLSAGLYRCRIESLESVESVSFVVIR